MRRPLSLVPQLRDAWTVPPAQHEIDAFHHEIMDLHVLEEGDLAQFRVDEHGQVYAALDDNRPVLFSRRRIPCEPVADVAP